MNASDVPNSALAAIRAAEIHRYNEDPGTKAIAKQIPGARTEVPYPAGSVGGRCDLVVPTTGGGAVWIERKNAWTYASNSDTAHGHNGFFRKHLLSPDPSEHSALHDLRSKLPSLLGCAGVDAVGMQLMVFDSLHEPFNTEFIDQLEREAGAGPDSEWTRHEIAPWMNPLNPQGAAFIRAYYWQRA